MEVILLEKVAKLGDLGDKVNVKSGFGRNFLIPYGKAVPATEENLKEFEARRAELQASADEVLAVAKDRAEKMTDLSITIKANAGDEGKLFGSVGTKDISDELVKNGFDTKKSEVRLPTGAIREIGEYDINLQLHSDVNVAVKVIVAAE
jgi:large subunit ribosomal protein L9